MKTTTNQKVTAQVVLVKNGKTLYPKTNDDYEALKQLRLPVDKIDQDFLPLLETVRKLHKLRFTIIDFADLEQKMFKVAEDEWPFDFSTTGSSIVLKAPKNIKQERLDKFVGKIRAWYIKHNFTVEVVPKRTAKSLKVIVTKRLQQE